MTELKTTESRRPQPDAAVPPAVFDPTYRLYPPEESIDLFEVWRALWSDRLLIVVIVLVAGTIGVISGFTMRPVYRAEVLMAPALQSGGDGISAFIGQLGGLGALLEGYAGGGKDQTAESLATLSSRSFTIDFINQRDIKRHLFSERWDEARQQWRPPARAPTDLEAFEALDGVRSVRVDRRGGLVSLAIEWNDPVVAADWANALVQRVNERRRAEAVNEARKSIDYLRNQAARTQSVEILQAIYRLIEAQTKTITLANSREDFAFKVIDRAVPPEKRIRPNRSMMAMIAAMSGFIVAGVVVLIRHSLRRRGFLAPKNA